ncbi:MAG: alpha/beta hydrolase [Acidobacteria bacterium]|nr:MAG: alpha/beta hydrolase [Acidobacteriota bacterium]
MRKLVIILVLAFFAMNCGFLLVNYRPDVPPERLNEEYADGRSRFVAVDGANVHLRDEGEARAGTPPLVLIHGTAASLHTWEGWVRELSHDLRLIRFDLPGFGLTGPNEDHDYRISRYARTLDALLDALGVGRVDVAGNSLGGYVAWVYALERPQRVRRLILIDAAGYASDVPGAKPTTLDAGRVPLLRSLLRKVTPRSLVRSGLLEVYADDSKVTPALVERYYRLLLRAGNRDALIARLSTPWEDREGEIPSIRQPTLIQWGGQDRWIPPAVGERFHADLPHSELLIYDDLGHVPMEEDPVRTARDARAFLLRPEPAAESSNDP